ncbi:hypothetical protein DPMN_026554 [Dreissena polymorpha]|uniref:Uncharacterized protein n=1 Tax=Dreissena polymorpha TaxID=45954 RepID=A0A9D4REP8_DREPO|nr:hypothetical protein DPMN_026554 [Dreissena polymorpha]
MPRPLGGHVFPQTGTIFELIQDIIGTNHLTKVLTSKNAPPPDIIRTNLLTKFHEDRKINVASRVLTRKNAPSPGSPVFQPTSIIFKFVQDIIGINLLTKFHEDRTINVASIVLTRKTAPPPGGHIFFTDLDHFRTRPRYQKNNVLTKNTAPPPGGHVFQRTGTIFELIQHII